MKPQHTLGQATTPDGGEIVLYERDGAYFIRVNGLELMTSRAHGSEEDLARLALAKVQRKKPKVLVGGLGMGFTLRAVLDGVPKSAKVMVAEILPAVIAWNRNELAHLAGSPLEDPRVAVVERDVADIIADVIGNNTRVAWVVFRNAGFDLADQIGADVCTLRKDAATDT